MRIPVMLMAALAATCGLAAVTPRGIRPTSPGGRDGLANPERGFRFEIYVGNLDADPGLWRHLMDMWPFPRFKADGVTVSQAYCYLSLYPDREIGAEKIAALEADFARARREGVKYLLRFAYDVNMRSTPTPTAETILRHIAQLKPVVRRNIDVIYCLQIGWVGAWGEFHSSALGIDKDPKAVADIVKATLDMLPRERSTMMRRVKYKIDALRALGEQTNEVTAATAHTDLATARIGFFNDATLANWNDMETFFEYPFANAGHPEFDRVAREGLYTPVDGELVWCGMSQPIYSDGLRTIDRLSKHHYTTFSLTHNHSVLDHNKTPGAIDGWKVTPVTADQLRFYGIDFDPDYFEGVPHRTAYEFIRDHLGYRLALKRAELPAADGKKGIARITLRNYGFAPPVNPRELFVVIRGAGGTVREMATGFDLRKLLPGLEREITVELAIEEGCRVGLWLPDVHPDLRTNPAYAVRLASELEVENVDGRLVHWL